jgi:hypothetical protein
MSSIFKYFLDSLCYTNTSCRGKLKQVAAESLLYTIIIMSKEGLSCAIVLKKKVEVLFSTRASTTPRRALIAQAIIVRLGVMVVHYYLLPMEGRTSTRARPASLRFSFFLSLKVERLTILLVLA